MRNLVIAFTILLCIPATAQTNPIDPDTVARIVGYSLTRGGASDFLESLTDSIGGRITGSKESQATANLILKALKEAGFGTTHLNNYQSDPGSITEVPKEHFLPPFNAGLIQAT